jgi:hypothetical protein
MIVLATPVFATVAIVCRAGVRAAFRLKRRMHSHKRCAKVLQHVLDHVIRPYAQSALTHLGCQVPIAEMPGESRELYRILVLDLDDRFWRSPHMQPPPVVELQTVSIGHGDRLRQIEKNLFAIVGSQANATPVTPIELESQSTYRSLIRPLAYPSMDTSAMKSHVST